jgi:hypothetical protein
LAEYREDTVTGPFKLSCVTGEAEGIWGSGEGKFVMPHKFAEVWICLLVEENL